MSTQFKLTEEERSRILAAHPSHALNVVEEIVASRWPEAPRWIPVTERMPTAADGMKGSTNRMDDGKVLWMTLRGGWHDGNAPDYAVAWCRIPDYVPQALAALADESPVGPEFRKPTPLSAWRILQRRLLRPWRSRLN